MRAWYGSLIDIFWQKLNPCKLKTRCIKMGGKLIDRKIRTKVMFHFFFPVQQKILRLLEEFCEFGKKGKNVPLIKWSEDQNNPKIGTRSLNSNYKCEQKFAFFTSPSFKPKPIIIDAKNFSKTLKKQNAWCEPWQICKLVL